jgi:outer membrane protein assembly factor BamD
MIVKTRTIVLFLITCLFFVSCTKELNIQDMGFEKSFRTAKNKFGQEKYREALIDLNSIILNYGGQNGIDSAQFLIGKSHYELGEFYSASYEFNRLSDNFPESELIEDSYYYSAECFRELSPRYTLDQKETYNAISKFQLYLDLFPQGKFAEKSNSSIIELREKLARKTFEAGALYLKLDQPRAAKIYFNEVIDNYYDTTFYVLSLEKIAQAYLSLKDEYNYQVYLSRFQEFKNKTEK